MDTESGTASVLLVEDEAVIALAEAQEIRALGYEVRTAHRGEEAVEIATADLSIDLVLMDIDLGSGIDGTEAAARILQSRDLPVIFLSSHTEKDIVERTSRITNYGYVTKSAGVTVLDASIRMAMRLFAATRQIREELDQRRMFENALMESTSLNRHIINNINEGLIVYDTNLRYVVWNPFMERLTGMKATDVRGKHPSQVFPELTNADAIANLAAALSGETPKPMEFSVQVRGREIRVVHSAAPLRIVDGTVIGAVSRVQDVTGAREDRDRLQKSEAKYRELFENAPIGIFRTDSKGRLLEANCATARFCGFATSEEAVHYYSDLSNQLWVDPEQRNEFLTKLEKSRHVENYEVCSKTADGRPFWVSLNARVTEREDSGAFTIEGFTIDISRMKESERRLEESNARINAMLQAIPDKVLRLRRDGGVLDYVSRPEDMYVTPEVEVIGKPTQVLLPSEISDLYKGKIRETLERRTLTTFTYSLEIRERGMRLREARMVPSGDDEVTVVIRDITEEAEKDARLIESEYLFRTAFDNAPIGITLKNLDGTIIRTNQAYCDMLGYSQSELTGRPFTDFTHPDDLSLTPGRMEKTQGALPDEMRFSKRYLRKDGSIVWAEVNVAVIKDCHGKPQNLLAQIRDITEQKESEASVHALVREKEVLLGEIHHRIKNNLHTMASLLSLQAQTMDNSPAVEALEEAQSRLRTMSVLYDRLQNAANFNEVSIADFLSNLTDEVVSSNPSTATVRVIKNFEDYIVSAQKLSSVGILVNELICNAMKYAYHGRINGNLWIETRRIDDRAVIAVADDGVGLPENIEIGTSTGFGLTVVGALAQQLEGEVRIERENGTRFEIEFPI